MIAFVIEKEKMFIRLATKEANNKYNLVDLIFNNYKIINLIFMGGEYFASNITKFNNINGIYEIYLKKNNTLIDFICDDVTYKIANTINKDELDFNLEFKAVEYADSFMHFMNHPTNMI